MIVGETVKESVYAASDDVAGTYQLGFWERGYALKRPASAYEDEDMTLGTNAAWNLLEHSMSRSRKTTGIE